MPRSEKKFLLFLALAALLVRMIYLYEMSSSPYFGAPFLDELYHLDWAGDIAAGKWLRDEPFFRAPLYSCLLGIFIRIFGVNFYLIRFTQHLWGVCAVLAVYFLTRRVFSRREAIIAGILAALYAPFIFFEGEMLDIFLQFLLYPLILIQIFRTWKMQTILNNLLLGILIGISAIARPNILLFVPVLLVFLGILWLKKRDSFGDVAFRFFFLFCGLILPIIPPALHNYMVGRCFVPISSYGGINFYIGNNPNADGYTARTARRMYYFGKYEDSVEMFAKEEARERLGRDNLNAAEISNYWFRREVEWIRRKPGAWIRLMLKKTVLFFNNYEIKNNKNMYFVTRYSAILRFFLSFLPFALVGSLGLIGLVFAMIKKRTPETLVLVLFFITYVIGVVLFFVSARYRAPVLVILFPFAGYALTTLWDASGARRQFTLFTGMGALVILMGLSFTDWYHIKPKDYSREHWSVGNCWFEKGNLDLAETHLRKALELDPDYDDALNNLGEALYKKQNYGDAMDVFKELINRHPDYVGGYNNLGVCYESLMMYEPAERNYRRALEIYPGHVRARINLAEVLIKQGKRDDAREEFEQALRFMPQDLRKNLLKDPRFQSLK